MLFFASFSNNIQACFTGSSVAVERIFLSGQDTIAFCCSSLHPGTIRDLMMVKHTLKAVNKSI
ncbi:uncharacterized protein FOMMEDRAFT_95993 [Fomitiporia mediterranea MF3/22]|uniref:uncharacterized protein n=1 Tax=Fomitiporia mediterranea (strain MF3/22) TaxID=694068 RepID=UPI00044079FF|nr:uncharacterized protein FOMMEDRAFT_95993 [Fomitiporia mediterranea MF3/22]EJC98540.1 hypothetical protein FOMMEDRAFT_95993 [Fomitiporia mediterranea MF3/22]